MPIKPFSKFIALESASGILLVCAAVLAILCNNSPLAPLYSLFLHTPLEIRVGALKIAKPLLLWINDGLMAIFFLLVGLEVKRELYLGQLSTFSKAALPLIAALGGMVTPAIIYILLNHADPVSLKGWAIPTATDIAFALGVLIMLGEKVPRGLKLFLLAVAVIDDIGAILIIAIFYAGDLSALSLILATALLGILILLNRLRVTKIAPYILLGIFLWICVLKSGVHATLAGVVLALCIPLKGKKEGDRSPAHIIEHTLHPWVHFGIMPLFAFTNAGVSLAGISLKTLFARVPLGIGAGLFIGKQAGVFGFSWIAVKMRLARMPEGVSWLEFYGLSVLCGIGFTMSLFIGSLAFEHGGPDLETAVRLGVLTGTLLSGVWGYALLRHAIKTRV